ncbi:MAG: 3-oxoacyl-ACP reductase FabG [Clostridiaceae bacterium]|nr:3-oxoacyl-ACP reductase FabG [Clostridiaceae bacterium]
MSKNAFITGGSRGIGQDLVLAFSKAGYNVCFTYNTGLEQAEKLSGGNICSVNADLSSPEKCRAAAQRALSLLGHIDALINNAGIAQQKLFTDITDSDWQTMVAINLSAPFYITREILPSMIAHKSGRIINISSMWGVCGASCEVHYSAVKAGLIGMTKALASEVAPSGITVNAIAPGVIDTDMYKQLGKDTMELVREDIPAGRIGTPSDISHAALFLAGDMAGYITGQVLGINGGMVI